jgi:hypothetical protein
LSARPLFPASDFAARQLVAGKSRRRHSAEDDWQGACGKTLWCRESVTTALGELKRAGILEIERQQDDVIDRAPLERAARD